MISVLTLILHIKMVVFLTTCTAYGRFTATQSLMSFKQECNLNNSKYSETDVFHSLDPGQDPEISKFTESCGFQSVAIISDTSSPIAHYLIRALTKSSVQMVHFDLQEQRNQSLLDIINTTYLDLGITDFILFVHNPYDVIEEAGKAFRKDDRGRTAAMPHRTRWVVFLDFAFVNSVMGDSGNIEDILFDNVGLLTVHYNTAAAALELKSVSTLMWRAGRRREFQLLGEVHSKGKCLLFPNIRYGLNGRRLDALARFHLSDCFLKMSKRNFEGKVTYSGFYHDVMHELAEDFNFTLEIRMTNVSWELYREEVSTGKTDVGLSIWRFDYKKVYSMSKTYPVLFVTLRGCYRHLDSHTRLGVGFQIDGYYVFYFDQIAFFVFAICLASLFFACLEEGESVLYIERNISRTSGSPSVSRHHRNRFQRIVRGHISAIWGFSTSSLNQATLPRPWLMSARIQVWSWSLMTSFIYFVFTGYLMSRKMKPNDSTPFESFHELVNQRDYSWGALGGDTLFDTIRESSDDILQALGKGLKLIDTDSEFFMEELISEWRGKFVLISNDAELNVLRSEAPPLDLTYMKEGLLPYMASYVFPEHSDLGDMLSPRVIRLIENGIVENLKRLYRLSPIPSKRSPSDGAHYFTGSINDLAPITLVAVGLLVVSSLALLVENIVVYTRKYRESARSSPTEDSSDTVLTTYM